MDEKENKELLINDAIGRKILEAAIYVIDQEGYENLTIRKVAKESGCSNTAIYMRFADKDALGSAVAQLQAKPLLMLMEENYHKEDSFLDNIQRMSRAMLRQIYQMDTGVVYMQMKHRAEKLMDNSLFIKKLEEYIKTAVIRGEIVVGNARMFAITLEASFWGFAYMCRFNKELTQDRADEMLKAHNQMLYAGMHVNNEDDGLWKKLKSKGVDVDKALERMKGNKEAYRNFLIEFFEDPDFEALDESLEVQDAKEAFEYAHGLKGMAANLGLEQIYGKICVLVEILRQGTVNGAKEAYDEVKESCQVILKLL